MFNKAGFAVRYGGRRRSLGADVLMYYTPTSDSGKRFRNVYVSDIGIMRQIKVVSYII